MKISMTQRADSPEFQRKSITPYLSVWIKTKGEKNFMGKQKKKKLPKPQPRSEEIYWDVFLFGCDSNSQKIVNLCLQQLAERGCILVNP
jgi:hypothetical protein